MISHKTNFLGHSMVAIIYGSLSTVTLAHFFVVEEFTLCFSSDESNQEMGLE